MMDRLPPRPARRLVLAPLGLALCLALIVASPLVLAAAALADLLLPGSWRTVRLAAFVLGYIALEAAGLLWMFVLWIASGFGLTIRSARMQRAHHAFMRWWLDRIHATARVTFHLRVRIEDPPQPRPGPVLVFSRHAGPGNSLLLIGTLVVAYHRRPRIVMLAKLQWEPLYDVMLNRLPNRFIRHDPARRELYTDAIGKLASDLGDQDAFVLFPEGKDFTPRVRTRAIEYLRRKGLDRAADRAEKMMRVLPPKHVGVLAALNGSPEAEVVLVAHTVLEDVGTLKQLWGRIPFDHPIAARYWRLPRADVPMQEDALIAWLYDWWERIDAWILAREAS
jgi:1-acyl-sn-glycerol-3-phosphate acyltransferase